jgi:hypothetical protein
LVKITPDKTRCLFYFALLILVVISINFALYEGNPTTAQSEEIQLIQQADNYYHKVTRLDNEMALEFYQRVISLNPSSPVAHSGLANAIVQRSIRLPTNSNLTAWEDMNLGQALSDGHLFNEPTKRQLNKVLKLSEKAIA